MSDNDDYGLCDACAASLAARYFTFDRLVERLDYDRQGETPDDCATVTVLRNEALGFFCGDACARTAALAGLTERGLRLLECGAGPIEPCAKCGGPVDLTRPHVAYQLMDQTEIREPWLTSIQPHDTETLAYVCPRCDGDLAAIGMDVPEPVEEERPAGLPAAIPAAIERE